MYTIPINPDTYEGTNIQLNGISNEFNISTNFIFPEDTVIIRATVKNVSGTTINGYEFFIYYRYNSGSNSTRRQLITQTEKTTISWGNKVTKKLSQAITVLPLTDWGNIKDEQNFIRDAEGIDIVLRYYYGNQGYYGEEALNSPQKLILIKQKYNPQITNITYNRSGTDSKYLNFYGTFTTSLSMAADGSNSFIPYCTVANTNNLYYHHTFNVGSGNYNNGIDASITSWEISNTTDLLCTYYFGDEYEQATYNIILDAPFINVHLAGTPTGGVALGKFSAATSATSGLFECNYPAYFYDDIVNIKTGKVNFSNDAITGLITAGEVTSSGSSSGGKKSVTISEAFSFKAPPQIFLTINDNNSTFTSSFTKVSYRVSNVTNNDFTIDVYNDGSNKKTFIMQWLAIGIPNIPSSS